MEKRSKNHGIRFGNFKKGEYNCINDVPGVRVGHKTLSSDSPHITKTGVTAIIPAQENIYTHPLPAAAAIINGFGKSAGIIQINELGRIETPIVLTNTLAVGTAFEAIVEYSIQNNPDLTSVNPVIGECNDSYLNDIRQLSITKQDVFWALENAESGKIETGSVGAGTGTVCFGYKGGIGSSSRIIEIDKKEYVLGVIVQSNYGQMDQLTIKGKAIKPCFKDQFESGDGSIMMVIATNIPLSCRQLKRVAKRSAFAIARTGGKCCHGSGEVAIAFSTANRIPPDLKTAIYPGKFLNENAPIISDIFSAAIDCIEESVVDSLLAAQTTKGFKGRLVNALPEDIPKEYGLGADS